MSDSSEARPILIYDDGCLFCRRGVARWKAQTGSRIEYLGATESRTRFPDISTDELEAGVQLVRPDGQRLSGADAIAELHNTGGHTTPWSWAYRQFSWVKSFSRKGYALIAKHRALWSRSAKLFCGPNPGPFTYDKTRWLFLRGLGLVFLIAFASFWVQAKGLVGQNGILPLQGFLEQAGQHIGENNFKQLPTIFWFSSSDATIQLVCAAGTSLSILLMLGMVPVLCCALLWFLYLSLSIAGQVFLGFQWDSLLIETGLLSVFLAPFMWTRERQAVSRIGLFLMRLLLFKLMFCSGVVKLTSGDTTWHNLTALTFHYETTCLPTTLSWFAHHLPVGFQKASTAIMFFIELVVPFFVFGPRRLRLFAFWLLAGLQLIIAATGNYAFFNLLTLILCITLLDDVALQRWIKKDVDLEIAPTKPWIRWVAPPFAGFYILFTGLLVFSALRLNVPFPQWTYKMYERSRPFRSVNTYGLFANMTTERPEIIIEGSRDGETWMAYEFKWKPGALDRRPRQVAPHQPRLDWQMWFAALQTYKQNPWFVNLLFRLMQGSPEVLELFAENPFPDQPPAFLRATVYEYQFTSPQERRETGEWWTRTRKGPYCPVVSLNKNPPTQKDSK